MAGSVINGFSVLSYEQFVEYRAAEKGCSLRIIETNVLSDHSYYEEHPL